MRAGQGRGGEGGAAPSKAERRRAEWRGAWVEPTKVQRKSGPTTICPSTNYYGLILLRASLTFPPQHINRYSCQLHNCPSSEYHFLRAALLCYFGLTVNTSFDQIGAKRFFIRGDTPEQQKLNPISPHIPLTTVYRTLKHSRNDHLLKARLRLVLFPACSQCCNGLFDYFGCSPLRW